jgi:hypothetical protein
MIGTAKARPVGHSLPKWVEAGPSAASSSTAKGETMGAMKLLGTGLLAMVSVMTLVAFPVTAGAVGASTRPDVTATRNPATDVKELERFRIGESFNMINEAMAQVTKDLNAMTAPGERLSLAEVFQMQQLMNRLSQLSEMSTSVVSASNSAISSMARNVKS